MNLTVQFLLLPKEAVTWQHNFGFLKGTKIGSLKQTNYIYINIYHLICTAFKTDKQILTNINKYMFALMSKMEKEQRMQKSKKLFYPAAFQLDVYSTSIDRDKIKLLVEI